MARPLRLEFAGALYHVTSRGDGREDIFRAVGDRRVFVDVLADQTHADRDQAIKAAYASGGYTMQEIGDYFALGLDHNSAHPRHAATSVSAGRVTGRGRRRRAGGGRATCASTWSNSAG